jgi:peptide/nickel transport system substrate-binding protein
MNANALPNRSLFWSSLLAALLCIALLVACDAGFSPGAAPDAAPTSAPTPAPSPLPPTATPLPRGGNLTVRLAADVPSLRPWQPRSRGEEQIIGLLYSGLMRLDAQLRPQPDLAEQWQATPDGRLLTFTLRSGLTWHDGAPLDAEDVRFTLDSMRSLPFTSTALLNDLQRILAVSAPSSTTVVISLTERYAPLLAELTLPILPRHLLQGRNLRAIDFWDAPVGSGPFQLADRVAGASVVLARYERFHRGAPLLDRVAFVVAPSSDVAIDALKGEQLLLAELPWSAARSVSGTIESLHTATYPENGFYFLGFNLREGRPFTDARLREALALAIDLPRLVEQATKGQGQPIASSAVPGSWADLTPPGALFDLERARALLDQVGWTLPPGGTLRQRDGITLTAQLFVRGDDQRRVVAAERIAQTAASIGMSIAVQPADFASVIVSKYAPPYDFDLLLGSWSNGAGDPDYADFAYYDPDDFGLFHSTQVNQGVADTRVTRNFVGFGDGAYDNQSQAARQLYDLAERANAVRQAQARVAALRPYLLLWADRLPVVLNTQVTTLDGPVDLASPMYLWNIERWYLQP